MDEAPPNKSDQPLEPWVDPAVEARIVALVLGEASDFEASELREQISAQPELRAFHDRMVAAHQHMKSAIAGGGGVRGGAGGGEWRLPEGKRAELLGRLRGSADGGEARDGARRRGGWGISLSPTAGLALSAAAAVAVTCVLFLGLGASSVGLKSEAPAGAVASDGADTSVAGDRAGGRFVADLRADGAELSYSVAAGGGVEAVEYARAKEALAEPRWYAMKGDGKAGARGVRRALHFDSSDYSATGGADIGAASLEERRRGRGEQLGQVESATSRERYDVEAQPDKFESGVTVAAKTAVAQNLTVDGGSSGAGVGGGATVRYGVGGFGGGGAAEVPSRESAEVRVPLKDFEALEAEVREKRPAEVDAMFESPEEDSASVVTGPAGELDDRRRDRALPSPVVSPPAKSEAADDAVRKLEVRDSDRRSNRDTWGDAITGVGGFDQVTPAPPPADPKVEVGPGGGASFALPALAEGEESVPRGYATIAPSPGTPSPDPASGRGEQIDRLKTQPTGLGSILGPAPPGEPRAQPQSDAGNAELHSEFSDIAPSDAPALGGVVAGGGKGKKEAEALEARGNGEDSAPQGAGVAGAASGKRAQLGSLDGGSEDLFGRRGDLDGDTATFEEEAAEQSVALGLERDLSAEAEPGADALVGAIMDEAGEDGGENDNGRTDRSIIPGPQPPGRASGPDLTLETSTAAERTSTFSLNVSDVAFQLAAAALLGEGTFPPAERVRPEEFVNAFDYGDPAPTLGEAVACQVDQAVHPFAQQRNLMRISMRTAAAGRNSAEPLHLTILLDKSGSMDREDREESVLRAMAALAGHLGPADRISAVAFARTPRLIAESLPGDRAGELVDLVARTPSAGGTNLERALDVAGEVAHRQFGPAAINRIVLITDGAANLGDADPESLMERVVAMRRAGIAFDACGVGADGLDDATLEALTRHGDGRYYMVDRPEDADAGFVRQLAGALRPAAKDVKVQVVFNPERVKRFRLLGFEKHRLEEEDFRDDTVDAAEMAAAESGTAVYQFQADPEGSGEVGEVFVRFRDTDSGEIVERSWLIPYRANPPRLAEAQPAMQLAACAALLAEKLKGGPVADAIELRELAPTTNELRAHFRGDPRVAQLVDMIETTRNLTGN